MVNRMERCYYYDIEWSAFPPAKKLKGCLVNWFNGNYSCLGVIKGYQRNGRGLVLSVQQTHRLLIELNSNWEPMRQKHLITVDPSNDELHRWSFTKKLPIFGIIPIKTDRRVTRYRIYPDKPTNSITIYGRGETLPFTR